MGSTRTSAIVLALSTGWLVLGATGDSWYYHDGPLAGSLKSDQPLPIYAKDADHIWNRLFTALYVRLGENPPPKKQRRIEGGDAYLDPLLWPETTHFSELEVIEKVSRLLDEFLDKKAAESIKDPLKRTTFQHDLWAVHDRLASQNLAWAKSQNQATRKLVGKREPMVRKLARAIKALALSKDQITALPDNYHLALKSGHFPKEHRFDPLVDYLPADLPTGSENSTSGDWVEITYPARVPPYHTHDFGGRSYFRIFYRFPEGRAAVTDYLKYVAEEGVERNHPDAKNRAVLKGAGRDAGGSGKSIRQIPAGTQLALLRQMVVLDRELRPVPTPVGQELRLRIFKDVEGKADAKTSSGEGVNIYSYELKRALAFDGLRHGGLERQPNDLRVYRPLFHFREDWGRAKGREGLAFLPFAQHCIGCHGHKPGENVGVYSMTSIHAAFSLAGATRNGPPGIVTPMPKDAPTQAERAVKLILGRAEYRLLQLHSTVVP